MLGPHKSARLVFVALLASILGLVASATAQQVVYFPQPALVGDIQHDLDGDGPLDLVSAGGPILGFNHAPIAVHAGRGNGTFEDGKELSGLPEHSALVGDVTGDGLADIVSGGHATSIIGWALHVYVGDGVTFGPPVETLLDDSVLYMEQALGDIDGDGRLDWVAITGDPEHLLVGISDGVGHFAWAPPPPLSPLTTGLALADFNGDGDLDVTVGNGYTEIAVYLGFGDGVLSTTPVVTQLPASPFLGPALCASDFDEDGIADLVAVSGVASPEIGSVVSVLHGHPDAHFTPLGTFPLSGLGEPLVGDVNGDQAQDIVVTIGGGAATLLGNASGFAAPILTPCNAVQFSTPQTFAQLADVDADGHLDLELFSSLLFGHGDGTFTGATVVDLPDGPQLDIVAADMNVDGEQDLVSVVKKKQPGGLFVSLGDGAGQFEPHTLAATGSTRVAAGDLDADGAPDLVRVSSTAPTATEVLFNDGSGLASASTLAVFDFGLIDLQLADVDADGALDVLGTKPDDSSLHLRRGDGAGGLLPAEALPLGGKGIRIATADFDGDGLLDVAASLKLPSVAFLRGLGAGALGAPQLVPVPVAAHVMLFNDLDADGLLDLVIASQTEPVSALHVLPARAPFSFGTATDLPLIEGPTVLLAADLDSDGRSELVCTDYHYEGALSVFRNEGGGGFAAANVTAANGKAGAVGDFNGDGRVDLALADDMVIVLPNVLGDFPNLGYQHPASVGTPHLVTTGKPVPDTQVSFTATGVKLPALGALCLGFDFTPQAFAGGTLVPSPDVIVPMRPGVPLADRWPSLPFGTQVFAQTWFATAGEVVATNAVMAVSL